MSNELNELRSRVYRMQKEKDDLENKLTHFESMGDR